MPPGRREQDGALWGGHCIRRGPESWERASCSGGEGSGGAAWLGSCDGGGGRRAQDCTVGWGCSPVGAWEGQEGSPVCAGEALPPALRREALLCGICHFLCSEYACSGQFQAAGIEGGSGRVVSLLQDTRASQGLCVDKGGWRLAWGRPALGPL